MAELCPICQNEPEIHENGEYLVIGCTNDDCPLSWKRSKYRYTSDYQAEQDWDCLVEAYREGKIRF